MSLTTVTFAQLQQIFATGYSSVAALPANTNPGSTLGSIANANALLALNIQGELVYVDGISRLATSFGADVDSFVNPFGVYRLGATYASGVCTCYTPSNVTQALTVPVGGIVQTANTLLFQILADPNNTTGFYSATANNGAGGYVIPVGQASCNVLVQCLVAGTIGNVQIGQITQPGGTATSPPLTGIAYCSNAAAFTNGVATETDAALKTRFSLLMSTGPVATDNALAAAILAVQPGLTYTIGDALNSSGASAAGVVTVFVNVSGSASGAPPGLLTQVATALSSVRAAGVTVNVVSPATLVVNVTANVKIAAGYSGQTAAIITSAAANLSAYLSGIGLSPNGSAQLAQYSESIVALRTTPGVANVTALQLNGGTNDVSAGYGVQIVVGTVTLTPY